MQSSSFYEKLLQSENKHFGGKNQGIFVMLMTIEIGAILDEYEFKVRQKEKQFLTGEPVNLSFLVASFSKEFRLFYELLVFLNAVFDQDDLRGGVLLDELFRKTINGDEFTRVKFQRIFQKVYGGFFRMCSKWLLFGKIEDPYEEFFIKDTRKAAPFLSGMELKYEPSQCKDPLRVNADFLKPTSGADACLFYFKNEAQANSNWDNDFVLQVSLLPKCLVKVKTAKSILFIGKCLKVIQSSEGVLGPTCRQMNGLVEDLRHYDSIGFVRSVQSLKRIVSANFMALLLESPALKTNLGILKDFFLLFKEEFYSIFTEEMSGLMRRAPDKYSQDQVNKKVLPNCLLRLGIPPENVSYGALSFLLKAKGFSYKNFKNTANLKLCGNVEQKFSSVRLKSADNFKSDSKSGNSQSSLWNVVLQNVQKGFDCALSFRFKSGPRIHPLSESSRETRKFGVCLCLQSAYDVRSSKKVVNLTSAHKLDSGLFIEFGFAQFFEFDPQLQTATRRAQSFVELSFRTPQFSTDKVVWSQDLPLDEMNFADQDIVYVRVRSSQKLLKLLISNENFLQSKTGSAVGSSLEVPFDLDQHFLLTK